MHDPFRVVREFEHALCTYTGARYAVTTNSCTMAILLSVAWHLRTPRKLTITEALKGRYDERWISIPKRTYISVPMSIIHAGGRPIFRDEEWTGAYELKPLNVWDCARRFTSGMYQDIQRKYSYDSSRDVYVDTPMGGHFLCVSFHQSKILGDSQGGAILHDNAEADIWLRKARFDGRTEGVPPIMDTFDLMGYHCYMSPDIAARLLWKLSRLPHHNDDLPNDDYPDLSTLELFK